MSTHVSPRSFQGTDDSLVPPALGFREGKVRTVLPTSLSLFTRPGQPSSPLGRWDGRGAQEEGDRSLAASEETLCTRQSTWRPK